MSKVKWQELTKRETELGDKINFVHDTILNNQKVFKIIITKLDDVSLSYLKLPNCKQNAVKNGSSQLWDCY